MRALYFDGHGSVPRLSMVLLTSMAGIDLAHVPYQGGVPQVTAEEFAQRIRMDEQKYGKLIEAAGVKADGPQRTD